MKPAIPPVALVKWVPKFRQVPLAALNPSTLTAMIMATFSSVNSS